MKKEKRILHVVSNMHRGGAETMIMNLYRNIDRERVQFDFLCHYKNDNFNVENVEGAYDKEIKTLGGRIFKVPSLGSSNPLKYIKNIQNVIKENGPFEAIHVHTNKQAGFALLAARLRNIKKRIVHCHTSNWSYKNKVMSKILRVLIKVNANIFCSCEEEMMEKIFNVNNKKEEKIYVLNNSIEIDKFVNVSKDKVLDLKKNLEIRESTKVVGHIGRFSEEKNHQFIIDIAKEFKGEDIVFLLIGDGPLKKQLEEQIMSFKLVGKIKILGIKENINEYMNLFDVFLLPSLFEGIPLVLIEAQATSTKCLISNKISKAVDMDLGLIKTLGIKKSDVKLWKKHILELDKVQNHIPNVINRLTEKGYNVQKNKEILYEIYGV